jgi:hypothetical protein
MALFGIVIAIIAIIVSLSFLLPLCCHRCCLCYG